MLITNGQNPSATSAVRHVQASAADEEGVAEVVGSPWSRHRQEDREIPEQDLQQRWDVTKDLHIDGRQLGDYPVLRQACDADDEPQDGRQDHANEGYQQSIEQTDDKDAGIAVRFGVVDQVLGDAETGTALQKAETGSDAPVCKVGLRVIEQKPAQRDDRHDGDDLKYPRTHSWIAEAEPLLRCAD